MIKTIFLILIFSLIFSVNSKQRSLNNFEQTTSEDQKANKEKILINDKTKDSIQAFSSKDLIKKYFNPTGFRTDSIALIDKDDKLFEIQYLKTESYLQNGEEFILTFFSIYQLILSQNELIQDISTGGIGSSRFSIIKFKKEGDKWTYINKWDDLETGINIRDKTYLPHIIQKNGIFFLELPDVIFYASGTKEKTTILFNTTNFKKILEINSASYNGEDDVDEFITNMNNEIYDKDGIFRKDFFDDLSLYLWNTSDYKLEYKTIKNNLYVYIHRAEGLFNEQKKIFIKITTKETYIYDTKTLKFIRINGNL